MQNRYVRNQTGSENQQILDSGHLERNASPSSSQPSNGAYVQSYHYSMKPLETLVEDPLDLTVVQEDSQTQHEAKTFETHFSLSSAMGGIMPDMMQQDGHRRLMQPKTEQKQQIKKLDLRQIGLDGSHSQQSRSPSSSGITETAGIEDIKNASLYDLIKLQMQNQQKVKKVAHTDEKMRKRSSRQSTTQLQTEQSENKLSEKLFSQPQTRIKAMSFKQSTAPATDINRQKQNTSRSLLKNPEDVVSDSSKNASMSRSKSFLRQNSNKIGSKEFKKEPKAQGPMKPQSFVQNKIITDSTFMTSSVGTKFPNTTTSSPLRVKQQHRNKEKTGRQSQQVVADHNMSTLQTDEDQRFHLSEMSKHEQSTQGSAKGRQPLSKKSQQKYASMLAQPKKVRGGDRSPQAKMVGRSQGRVGAQSGKPVRQTQTTRQQVQQTSIVQTVTTKKSSKSITKRKQLQLSETQTNNTDLVSQASSSHITASSAKKRVRAKQPSVKTPKFAGITKSRALEKATAQSQCQNFATVEVEQCEEQEIEQDNVEQKEWLNNYNNNQTQEGGQLIAIEQFQSTNKPLEQEPLLDRAASPGGRVSRAERSRSRSERFGTIKRIKDVEGTHQAQELSQTEIETKNVEEEQQICFVIEEPKSAAMLDLKSRYRKPLTVACKSVRQCEEEENSLSFNSENIEALSPTKQPSTISFKYERPKREMALKTPEVNRKNQDLSEEYLEVKRQTSKVTMFEDIMSMEDLKTERESVNDLQSRLTGLQVPAIATKQNTQESPSSSSSYQPSPMKPQNLRQKFESRNSIKHIISQINISTIQNITRIKKPQKSSQLIGQLFCMLLWVCKESTMPASTTDHLPKVPFQNLEDEFATWENVQVFLNQNPSGLYQEVQQILQRFPLPRFFIEQYLRKMQHKIQVESRCLGRITSTSFDLALSLVTTSIDWHCKPSLGRFNSKQAGSRGTPSTINTHSQSQSRFATIQSVDQTSKPTTNTNTMARNSANAVTQHNSAYKSQAVFTRTTDQDNKDNFQSMESSTKVHQQPRNKQDFVEQNKKQLRNKYQKYQPVAKSSSILQAESPTTHSRKQQQLHQFRQGLHAVSAPNYQQIQQLNGDCDQQDSRMMMNHSFMNQSRKDLSDGKIASATTMPTKQPQQVQSNQAEIGRSRTPNQSYLAASPTSTTPGGVIGHVNNNDSQGTIGASNSGPTQSKLFSSTVTSRNKMVGVRSVTHFSRQQMHSPVPFISGNLSKPSLMTSIFPENNTNHVDNQDHQQVESNELYSDDDYEPINLVLQNGVVSSQRRQEKAAEVQSPKIPSEIHQREPQITMTMPDQQMMTIGLNFKQATLTQTVVQAQPQEQYTRGKSVSVKLIESPTLHHSPSMPETRNTQKASSPEISQVKPREEAQNMNIIKVYACKPKKDWTERDSDDSFCIEPSNIGDYLDQQNRLHEALLQPRQRFTISPTPQVAIQSRDEAFQMIQAMREKLLVKGNVTNSKLPASPATGYQPQNNFRDESNSNNSEEEKEEAAATSFMNNQENDTIAVERQQSFGNNEESKVGAHDFSRPSYSEMQKMNFDNILQALEQDSSRMRGSRQEVKEEFKTVERIIYKEDVNENYDN